MECTVNGRYRNLTMINREKILHVLPLISLIYADLFNRCFFLPVQVDTPAGLKGQEVTHNLPPSITPYTVAQSHGLVHQGVMSVV